MKIYCKISITGRDTWLCNECCNAVEHPSGCGGSDVINFGGYCTLWVNILGCQPSRMSNTAHVTIVVD